MALPTTWFGGGELAAGLLLLAVSFLADTFPHDLAKTVLALGFGLVLAGGAKLERSGHIAVPKFLGVVGDASYTIYLTHLAIEGVLLKLAIKTHLHDMVGAETTYLIVLAGVVLAGCFAYKFIEKPLLDFLRRPRHPRNAHVEGTLEMQRTD